MQTIWRGESGGVEGGRRGRTLKEGGGEGLERVEGGVGVLEGAICSIF